MKLKHITFTGIDVRTDLQELVSIQKQYPKAEFGVLTSYHWYENGNRYPDPLSLFISKLKGKGLNLALHVCGRAAADAANGFWNIIDIHLNGNLSMFGRIQLNISNRQDVPHMLASTPDEHTEVIIQQKDVRHIDMFEKSKSLNTSILLDASGGLGIDTPVEVLPNAGCHFKVGYAGGFGPDNVRDKLAFLMENEQVGDFWIDMESRVRTDDWFDLEKVKRVLETCAPIINAYA